MRYPADFEGFRDARLILCGTPGRGRELLEQEAADSGCNYMLCRFAYGDLSYDEAAGSLEMFVGEVLPHFN